MTITEIEHPPAKSESSSQGVLELKPYEDKLNLCNDCRCGFCVEGCPVYFATGLHSVVAPKGRNQVMAAALKGDTPPDKSLLEAAYICSTCGWCTEVCPQNNFLGHEGVKAPLHMPSLNTGFRDALQKANPSMMPAGALYLCQSVTMNGSVFKLSRKERVSWSKNLDLPKTGERLFFASCMSLTMGYAEKFLRRSESFSKIGLTYERLTKLATKIQPSKLDQIVLKLLSMFSNPNEEYTSSLQTACECLTALGIKVAYMGEDEPCCGAPYHTYGQYDNFKENAQKVYKKFEDSGVKEIVTLNPICGAMLRNYFPEVLPNFDIKVTHFSEIVSELLEEGNYSLGLPSKQKIVFHDPCHLSRHQRVVDAPRKILRDTKNAQLVEPVRTKFNSRCAGCGGLEATHPSLAKKIAEDRAQELVNTGADCIVTSCPACVMMLKLAVEKSEKKIDVIELSDFAMGALAKSQTHSSKTSSSQ